MALDLDTARFLITPEGRALVAQAEGLHAAGTEALTALTRLRKEASAEQSAAAWEMAVLRPRAVAKMGADGAGLFVTRESLEQASGRRASAYHAAQMAARGALHIVDACGGIGADALAFARAGLHVTLYETDPVRALFAWVNAADAGVGERVEVREEDVTVARLPPGAVWFDPARREGGRRIVRPEECVPPLGTAREWMEQGRAPIGIKLAPAIEHSVAAAYGCALEFVSDGGECKEALLWRGDEATTETQTRAVLLTDAGEHVLDGDPRLPAPVEVSAEARYLYEPDAAVIRAHLVGTLAAHIGARAPDPQIAYLTGNALVPTPFARAWKIVERFAYSKRALQQGLTRQGAGQVIIKKRGFPLEPEQVRAQLKLSGAETLTVVLTRQGDTHVVFLCRPVGV